MSRITTIIGFDLGNIFRLGITTGCIVGRLECTRLVDVSDHKIRVLVVISELNTLWQPQVGNCQLVICFR
ncbi:hypothetical protein D3C85_1624480 [compost metagenome]